jgi:ribosomal protein S18 acetylase RimI-like enzyme
MPVVLKPSWTGRRVSVRRVVGRRPDDRELYGDVVGDLVHLDAEVAIIDTRAGLVEVPVSTVAIARVAPPSTADELALEAVAAAGWQAAETAQLGGWVLRATGGFTGRANSVLPLRAPGLALDDALQQASAWYRERGLPLKLLVPTEARRLLDAGLAERGWPADYDVHVMAGRLDALGAGVSRADAEVTIAAAPDDQWFSRYRDGAGASPVARALLTRHDTVGFASVRGDNDVVAIGRATIDDGWLGVTAVEVDPATRRSGLATTIMNALWQWGRDRGADRSYLQVSADNAAAVGLYEKLGYWVHHDYRYRTEPPAGTLG